MSTSKETKIRLNLLMPQETKDLIDNIQRRTGAGSMTIVIRQALALLDIVTEIQEKENGKLYVHRPDGTEEEFIIIS